MIFPKDFEEKVGFNVVRQLIVDNCETRLGKDEAVKMSFSDDFEKIEINLRADAEMKGLLQSGSYPAVNVNDILPWLGELKADGSYINAEKLCKISTTLQSMDVISKFFNNWDDEKLEINVLKKLFKDITVFPEIIKEINNRIDGHGEVKDNASEELLSIRKSIRGAQGSMQKAMQAAIQKAVKDGVVESDVKSGIRDGRLVIPVAAANKKMISGIVHDMSASGKTVFIEPLEVVDASNRLRQLEMEEQHEIVVILQQISEFIRPYIEEIKSSCRLMGKYDFITAKAKFAIETNGELPHINRKPELEWYHAIHPGLFLSLKKRNEIPVPLDIILNEKQRILIISGPNAGGKSVCLKTVAVVQYMMQCGILPTLYYNSHMGIFKGIFIDIGDEQSIENDLSTYSSHLANMKFFLQHANKNSLILADEMGSGTEPQIGGSLAQSILEKLGKSGCMGVVTTHYQNLKTFAEKEEGFINGAMLYDRQHLSPTFKLSIGHPGSSFALDIARKIGLPLDVIENAKSIVGTDYVDLDKYLLDIQRDRKYWQNKRLSIKEKEHKLDKLLEQYEDTSENLRLQRSEILKNAREEAKEILAGANAMIERSIHEIKKAEAEKERTRQIRRELDDYKKDLSKQSESENIAEISELKHKSKKSKNKKNEVNSTKVVTKSNDDIEVGSYVRLTDGGVVGKVLAIDGKNVEVAFGNLRSKVDIKKLVKTKKPKENIKNSGYSVSVSSDESRERQLKFKTDIDVRGMRTDEALQAVTYFLDDALQFNARRLRILHGTGQGILKTQIRQLLHANSNVSHFEDEDIRLGGAGITVVEL